jgi:hypothetical protein
MEYVQHIIQNQTTTTPKISPIGLLVVVNALLGWKRKMHETETSYTFLETSATKQIPLTGTSV